MIYIPVLEDDLVRVSSSPPTLINACKGTTFRTLSMDSEYLTIAEFLMAYAKVDYAVLNSTCLGKDVHLVHDTDLSIWLLMAKDTVLKDKFSLRQMLIAIEFESSIFEAKVAKVKNLCKVLSEACREYVAIETNDRRIK